MRYNLHKGFISINGQVEIIDSDTLCYLVKNNSKGAVGVRTISKTLLNEYVDYFEKFPTNSSEDARKDLSGRSLIDKFEYGYTSTLTTMAKMVLGDQLNSEDKTIALLDNNAETFYENDDLYNENLRKTAFLKYFSNYLRLSTGKISQEKINQYLSLLDKTITKPIKALHPEFSSIFSFGNRLSFSTFIENISDEIPSLQILRLDSWPKDKSQQTLYYEPWTLVRHYRSFLDIISDIASIEQKSKELVLSVSDNSFVDIKTQQNYLRAMRAKPFLLLAGISGTGKSRIVKQMAFDSCPDHADLRRDVTSPGNYCLIEVKPNWHDSTELLGYESKIGGAHYQITPFVKFLAKAMLYPEVPFFVCLDEMNLAPVEQYFAEFLSVLESRTKIDRHIVSEPLVKADIFANKDYELKLQDDLFGLELKEEITADGKQRIISGKLSDETQSVYDELKKHGLRIPKNVIVIGTVNMDETTHQFSRKVIDRAMTIEMNLPDGNPFMDFFDNASELKYRTTPTSPGLYLATETKASEVVKALAADNAEKTEWLKGEVAKVLTDINSVLEGTPFKVAYRVQNELMLYFYQLWMEDKNAKWRDILNISIDQILMMKVLPRIEGDEELLEKPLERLISYCGSSYPNAANKLKEMKQRLSQSRFTSFWP